MSQTATQVLIRLTLSIVCYMLHVGMAMNQSQRGALNAMREGTTRIGNMNL